MQQVECTNCGDVGPAFWVTVGALMVAAIALYFAFRQHRELLRRLKARAELRLILRSLSAYDDGVIRTEGNTGAFRVSVGIKNDGDLAAGATLINVLFPRGQEIVWCGPNGEPSEEKSHIAPAGEGDVVTDPESGESFDANYINRTLPRVSTRSHHEVFFQFRHDVPDEGEVRVPFRVKVQADEIPQEIEEYEEELVVRVQRGPDLRA